MCIPTINDLLPPILELSNSSSGVSTESPSLSKIAYILSIPAEVMKAPDTINGGTIVRNLISEALEHLEDATYVRKMDDGSYCITGSGMDILASALSVVTLQNLEDRNQTYRENRAQRLAGKEHENNENTITANNPLLTEGLPFSETNPLVDSPSQRRSQLTEEPPEASEGRRPGWPFPQEKFSAPLPGMSSIIAAIVSVMGKMTNATKNEIRYAVFDLLRDARTAPRMDNKAHRNKNWLTKNVGGGIRTLSNSGFLVREKMESAEHYRITDIGMNLFRENMELIETKFLKKFSKEPDDNLPTATERVGTKTHGKPGTSQASEGGTGVAPPQKPETLPLPMGGARSPSPPKSSTPTSGEVQRLEEALEDSCRLLKDAEIRKLVGKIRRLKKEPLHDLAVRLTESLRLASPGSSEPPSGKWSCPIKGLFDSPQDGESELGILAMESGQAKKKDIDSLFIEMEKIKAYRGVIFSPHGFSKEAMEVINKSPGMLCAAGARKMAELMFDNGVGVYIFRTVERKSPDRDFFDRLNR
jgi:restriction endonuclease Mrr